MGSVSENAPPPTKHMGSAISAAQFVRIIVKFIVKFTPVAYGKVDCDFDFDRDDWGCSYSFFKLGNAGKR